MTIEQIKTHHNIMLQKEIYSCLDPSEKAIIDYYLQSNLRDKLYIQNYGAGGITFTTGDGREVYIALEREYDEDGREKPRHGNSRYGLLEFGKETEEPPAQTLEEIFRELEILLN